MPNPKDYMDEKHEYVRGYARRKRNTSTNAEKPARISWYWRIAWYWRLFIIIGAIVGLIVIVEKKPLVLLAMPVVWVVWEFWRSYDD